MIVIKVIFFCLLVFYGKNLLSHGQQQLADKDEDPCGMLAVQKLDKNAKQFFYRVWNSKKNRRAARPSISMAGNGGVSILLITDRIHNFVMISDIQVGLVLGP